MHAQPKHKSLATNDAAHVPNYSLCADSDADIKACWKPTPRKADGNDFEF